VSSLPVTSSQAQSNFHAQISGPPVTICQARSPLVAAQANWDIVVEGKYESPRAAYSRNVRCTRVIAGSRTPPARVCSPGAHDPFRAHEPVGLGSYSGTSYSPLTRTVIVSFPAREAVLHLGRDRSAAAYHRVLGGARAGRPGYESIANVKAEGHRGNTIRPSGGAFHKRRRSGVAKAEHSKVARRPAREARRDR
jgi:hypothetical protein